MGSRKSYSLEFKLQVLEFVKTNSGEAAARKFGVAPSSIRDWKKQANEFVALVQANEVGGTQKRMRNLRGGGRKRKASPASPVEAELLTIKIEEDEAPSSTPTDALLQDSTETRPTHHNDAELKSKVARNEPPTCCSNCSAPFSSVDRNSVLITTFTTTDTANGEEKVITATEAIQTIFEAGLKLNHKSVSRSTDLNMCFQCISFLAELYRFYVEFMELTKFDSIFQKLISKSLIWNFPESSLEKDEDEDDEAFLQSKIKVEYDEPEELYESDPGFDPETFSRASSQTPSDEDSDQDYRLHSSKSKSSQDAEEVAPPTVLTRSMRLSGGKGKNSPEKGLTLLSRSSLVSKQKLRLLKRRKTIAKATYKCTKCSKTFKDSNALSVHTTNRHSATRHQCNNCEKSFKVKKLLNRHLRFKHGESPPMHVCTKCSKSFSMPYLLRAHLRKKHATAATTSSVACTICSLKFPGRSYLRTHFEQEHPNEVLEFPDTDKSTSRSPKCPYCSEFFNSRSLLEDHITAEHPTRRFQCPQCPKTFSGGKLFRRHLKYKHGDGSEILDAQVCTVCSKSFPIASQLKRHMESVHAETKPFPCPQCDKMFPTEHYVQCHILRCHSRKLKQFKCEHCDKVYNSLSGYQLHVDIKHLDKKDFVCETCGKRFARSDWLQKHIRTHDTTRTREFKCEQCEQAFLTQLILNNHMKTHAGIKQHLCPHCGTEFLHAVSLRRHIQVRHVNEVEGIAVQSHKCQQCGKVFKLREYLLQHLRSRTHGGLGHTSERKKDRPQTSKSVKSILHHKRNTTELDPESIRLIRADPVVPSFPPPISMISLPLPESTANWYNTFYTS